MTSNNNDSTHSSHYSSTPIRWLRTNRKHPCMVCNRPGWCEVSDDGRLVHCMRTPSDRPSQWRGGGWLHGFGPSPYSNNGPVVTSADLREAFTRSNSNISRAESGHHQQPSQSQKPSQTQPLSGEIGQSQPNSQPAEHKQWESPAATPEPEPIEPLQPDQLDTLNRALLAACPITSNDRIHLLSQGVPSQVVERCGSLRYAGARSVAEGLVSQFGEELCRRHPALLWVQPSNNRRGWWTIAAATDGILLPATNAVGLVTGIQIRKERPQGTNDRYRWLSHDSLGGTPLTVFRATPGATNLHQLLITEGFKKGAIAASHFECNAISLAGVTAYKFRDVVRAIEAIEDELELELEENNQGQETRLGIITLAFDQDKHEKPQVRQAEQTLLRRLAATFPDKQFYILNWNSTAGKGLDDALHADQSLITPANFHYDPVTLGPHRERDTGSRTGSRLVTDLPVEALARQFGSVRPLYTVEEARRGHRTLLDRLVQYPDHSHRILTSPTGTGKSQAADDAVAEAALNGRLGRHRILLLAPNKANIAERIGFDPATGERKLLGQAVAQGLVAVQRGRNYVELNQRLDPDYASRIQPEDCVNELAAEAGANRHTAARVVCSTCPFGSQPMWQAHADEWGLEPTQARPFRCEVEGYLHTRKLSQAAQVVLATKESFLNNSDRLLAEFEVVICDEDLLPHLIETITIGTAQLGTWREKIALKHLDVPDWQHLIEIIERAFESVSAMLRPALTLTNSEDNNDSDKEDANLTITLANNGSDLTTSLPSSSANPIPSSSSSTPPPSSSPSSSTPSSSSDNNSSNNSSRLRPGRLLDAREPLECAARDLGYNLADVLDKCGDIFTYNPGREYTYSFEQPYQHNSRLRLPFRAGTPLLLSLQRTESENQPYFQVGADGSVSLVIYEVRHHLIQLLDDQTLVVLDATEPPLLKMLFGDLKEVRFEVPQNLEVTQVMTGLYSKQDLYNPRTRQILSEAIESFHAGSTAPLTMLPLRFQTGRYALDVPEGSQVEHWGLHKATSRYAGCDSLVLVGHHLRPLDQIRAEVRAVRAFIRAANHIPNVMSTCWDRTTGKNDYDELVGGDETTQTEEHRQAPVRDNQEREGGQRYRLRLYNCRLPYDGCGGKWCKADEDEDVQAAIEHDYIASIVQAIGRLRAALRSEELAPARVLILCNEPVGELRVDRLVSIRELLGLGEAEDRPTQQPIRSPLDNNSCGQAASASVSLSLNGLGSIQPPMAAAGKVEVEVGVQTDPERATRAVLEGNFISNIYMESAQNSGLVSSVCFVGEALSSWEEALLQDETPQSQLFEPGDGDIDPWLQDPGGSPVT